MIWIEFYAFVSFKKKFSGHLNNDASGKGLRRRAAHGQQLRWTRGTKRKQPLGLASVEVDWTEALERPGPKSSSGSSKGLFLETPIFQRDLFITPPAKYNRSGRGSELQGRVVTICSRGSQQVGEALRLCSLTQCHFSLSLCHFPSHYILTLLSVKCSNYGNVGTWLKKQRGCLGTLSNAAVRVSLQGFYIKYEMENTNIIST